MQRFRSYGQLDDTPLNDGDPYFLGFYSRYQPTYLKTGQLFYSGNMRMDRGTCQVRKGLKALSNDISLNNPTLVVGAFSLANSFSIASITRSSNTATVTTNANHGYATTNRVNIRGANQTDYNGDYTITVTGVKTFTYTVANTPVTPATGTMFANKGPRVFNNYNTQLVGSGDYADSNTNTEGIIVANPSSAYLYRYGQSTITISYPSNETCDAGSPCCLMQFLNKVYLFRGYSTSTAAPLSVSSITRSSTTATVTTASAHGLSTNNWVTIVGAVPDGYNGIVQITVTGANTFTYTVGGALTTPATGTITERPCKPPMSWDMVTSGSPAFVVVPTGPNSGGTPLINMPAVDWGVNFIDRLILPWSRDQYVLSDLFGAGTYDPSQNQFRILPGTNDWVVAAFPYQQLKWLALYRKSVHLVVMDSAAPTSLANAYATELTRNFGCVARRTVVNCGPTIAWLSDVGVVQMQIGLELNLTAIDVPLSDPIQDLIDTINWTYAGNAVATFWHNRYYLAVPTGDSTVNNTIFIYNFLNQAWESVDTYPDGFDVLNFHIISYNGTKRVHAVSTVGYVTLLEENNVDEFGSPGAAINFPIPGSLKTRNYLYNTSVSLTGVNPSYEVKKVKRFQLEANVISGDTFTGSWVLSNPDSSQQAFSYASTDSSSNDVSIRSTVNRRGVSGRLELASTAGRPEFKAVTVESAVTTRGTYNLT